MPKFIDFDWADQPKKYSYQLWDLGSFILPEIKVEGLVKHLLRLHVRQTKAPMLGGLATCILAG